MTKEREKQHRDWLAKQDALYAPDGVWHGLKQEDSHKRVRDLFDEVDRLRAERDSQEENIANMRIEIADLRAALTKILELDMATDFDADESQALDQIELVAREALEGK